MPLVLGAFLRQLVIALSSGALVTVAQNVIDGSFRDLVRELKDTEGLTEQEAKDVVGNIVLELAINSATIMTILKTGVGVKAAEYLGLTSRNFGKAALNANAQRAADKLVATGGRDLARRLLVNLKKIVPGPVGALWLFLGLTQVIEPAIYQPAQTERIWKALGFDIEIPRAEGNLTPGPFGTDSAVTFSEYATSIEAAGVKGINNPAAFQSQLYSRAGLADLVNYVYGQEIFAGRNPKVADLIPKLTQYLVYPSSSNPLPSPTPSVTTIPSTPKVYTGIVAQGVIGKGLVFTPRPDDLIESLDELKQAAANNLTAYLETLLGKVVYEVKIVASVITKDGFKQTGQVQQIKTGTNSDGTPKYKTVYNKFAVVDVFVVTDKGTRSKITSIVLGPTNSAKLNIATNDLRSIEGALPSLVTTTNISEIKGIETANSVTISTPPGASGASVPAQDTASVVTAAAPVSIQDTRTSVPGDSALTLFEWYLAQGQPLPSVGERSVLYESLGLGLKSFYSGTAEQNSKLLAALKKRAAQQIIERRVEVAPPSASKSPSTTTPKKGTSTAKSEPKRVLRSYTTTGGERVTKYSDGSETRTKVKK